MIGEHGLGGRGLLPAVLEGPGDARRGLWRGRRQPGAHRHRHDGVWLGGGIAPKILPRLTDGLFLQTFLAKGRFTPFLERVPVHVILNQRTAMLGAARRAASLL